MSSKNLICFMSHIDDFEISCLGYLFKHANEYNKLTCIIATHWEAKNNIWQENLKVLEKALGRQIDYVNLGFEQRQMHSKLDDIKNMLYSNIDFSKTSRFDILTHDDDDCHTDHVAAHLMMKGLYKYANRFVTVYSPSSLNFKANYWVNLTEDNYKIKKNLLDKYDINVEQSYTKLGYYLQDSSHYNIGNAYYKENFVHQDENYHECYRILKWS